MLKNTAELRGLHDGRSTSENRTCPGKDIAVVMANLFCITLLAKFEWRLKTPPGWDRHRFSLNVAAPKGALDVDMFRSRETSMRQGSDKLAA